MYYKCTSLTTPVAHLIQYHMYTGSVSNMLEENYKDHFFLPPLIYMYMYSVFPRIKIEGGGVHQWVHDVWLTMFNLC